MNYWELKRGFVLEASLFAIDVKTLIFLGVAVWLFVKFRNAWRDVKDAWRNR